MTPKPEISSQHPNTNHERIQQELEVIKNTPFSYLALTGDLLHGIHWGGAGGAEQTGTLDEQRMFLGAVFKELKGKVLFALV